MSWFRVLPLVHQIPEADVSVYLESKRGGVVPMDFTLGSQEVRAFKQITTTWNNLGWELRSYRTRLLVTSDSS